ncbi:MAG: hypothetical protein M1823_004239 [Watsoniomyces obsoletus]|nr:MAG: hypothetical protein M1823_004239 [Watsoniomyces obsoletus]
MVPENIAHSAPDEGFDTRLAEIQYAREKVPKSIQDYQDGESEYIDGKDFDAYVAWSQKKIAELRRIAEEAADAERRARRRARYASSKSSRLRSHDGIPMEIIFLPGLRTVEQLPRKSALIRPYNPPEPPPQLLNGFGEPLRARPTTIEATRYVAQVQINLMVANVAINQGRYEEAVERIREAMSHAKASKMGHIMAKCSFWEGVVLEKWAYYEQALCAFQRAEKCRGMCMEGELLDFHLQLVDDKLDVAAMARADSGFL